MTYSQSILAGWGLVTRTFSGEVLSTWYPEVRVFETSDEADNYRTKKPESLDEFFDDADREVKYELKFITCLASEPPKTVEDIYLRLHALSLRTMKPNTVNLDDIFAILENVVWTNFGPCKLDTFDRVRSQIAQSKQQWLTVLLVDKIPRMVDFVVPSGVRIGNADRIRLGAHLAQGTTVMHEGFCNFNAGTLGTSMVEGRISQGVVIGEGTDIGGGASIMGTLSGGGKEVVSLGERCLLGANAGIGIALGDDCVVEAGLYITAGTKLEFDGKIYKARDLSGQSNLLFIRDSLSGKIVVKRRKPKQIGIELNDALHKN